MKAAIIFLLCAVTAFAQEVKRPSVPSATTLASPTSQIAAWYRWAVAKEAEIAALKALPPPPTVDLAPVLAGIAELKTLITSTPPPPPSEPPPPTLPPPIILPPDPDSVKIGGTVTLKATADGIPAPTFKWYRNGVTYPGWDTDTIVLSGFSTNDIGEYIVEVEAANEAGTARASYTLNVTP